MLKKYRFVLAGVIVGLLVSIILFLCGQDINPLLLLSGAPYYIDAITVNSTKLVSFVCFIYFISLFSFIGYLITIQIKKKNLIYIILIIIVIHIVLIYLGINKLKHQISDFMGDVKLHQSIGGIIGEMLKNKVIK